MATFRPRPTNTRCFRPSVVSPTFGAPPWSRPALFYVCLLLSLLPICWGSSDTNNRPNGTHLRYNTPIVDQPTRRADAQDIGAEFAVPLFATHGSHHVTVLVGQPAQVQSLIVDTGSRLTGWACTTNIAQRGLSAVTAKATSSRSTGSNHAHKSYDMSQSTTVQPRYCRDASDCALTEFSSCTTEWGTTDTMLAGSKQSQKFEQRKARHLCSLRQTYTEGSRWEAVEVNDLVAIQGMALLRQSSNTTNEDGSKRRRLLQSSIQNVAKVNPSVPKKPPPDPDPTTTREKEQQRLFMLFDTTVAYTFACQTKASGQFARQYGDGILGLARSFDYSLVYRWHKDGVISRQAFSICASRAGGWMGLGGALVHRHYHAQTGAIMTTTGHGSVEHTTHRNKEDHHDGRNEQIMKFTPLKQDNKMYSIEVTQLWIGSSCLANYDTQYNVRLIDAFHEGRAGTILDSGTTDSFLPLKIADAFAALWKDVTGRSWDARTSSYTYKEMVNLPNLRIVFANNVTLEVTPDCYLGIPDEPFWNGKKVLTNRVYTDEPHGAVLGMNVVMNYDVLYDIEGGRMGFAKADCSGDMDTDTATS